LEALRYRSDGMGLVPYEVIARLTDVEWQRIQNVSRPALETVTVSRTTTPEMDRTDLDTLVAKAKLKE